MEAMDYAFGCVPFPSAGVGAPNIRERAYWVAHAHSQRLQRRLCRRQNPQWEAEHGSLGRGGAAGRLANANGRNACAERQQHGGQLGLHPQDRSDVWPLDQGARPGSATEPVRPSPVNGLWADADWIFCRDGKWRPVEPGFQQMADGSTGSLGRVCASDVEKVEEDINEWSIRYNSNTSEGLPSVWHELSEKALCEREIGRFSGVQSPAVLLAFLRQLTEQGWRFANEMACASAEVSKIVVRIMRFDASAACTPLRRELEEQQGGKPANPLRELSSILAYHAAKCWGEACREKAGAASFPLAENAPARVGRLRAYGNALNAEAAKKFIEAVMDLVGSEQESEVTKETREEMEI